MTIRERDILVDDDGDLVVGANGDLQLAAPSRTAIQDVAFRVRTQHNDFLPHPLIGANLSIMLGEPNNRRNGDRMRSLVQKALIRDGRFRPEVLNVEVVPVGPEDVVVLVGIVDTVEDEPDTEVVVASFSYNYTTGAMTIMR